MKWREKLSSKKVATAFPKVGDVLEGDYELLEYVNKGSMGVIMRAKQLQMDRDVAIKLLHPSALGKESLRIRFEREVHLAKKLNHPHTIRLFDFGVSDGMMYLVMELLEGEDLKSLLQREGPLPVGRGIEIMTQVADALAEAHSHDIIHRDLKPENIFLAGGRSRARDFVKVLDFGLAKSLVSEEFAVTKSGQVCGSAPYIAPEAIQGGEPGKHTDVYAAGLVLLETIIGRRVFLSKTVAATLKLHITSESPIPPAIQDTALAEVVRISTARDPDERYPDAAALMEALEWAARETDPEITVTKAEVKSLYASDGTPKPRAEVNKAAPKATNAPRETDVDSMERTLIRRPLDLLPPKPKTSHPLEPDANPTFTIDNMETRERRPLEPLLGGVSSDSITQVASHRKIEEAEAAIAPGFTDNADDTTIPERPPVEPAGSLEAVQRNALPDSSGQTPIYQDSQADAPRVDWSAVHAAEAPHPRQRESGANPAVPRQEPPSVVAAGAPPSARFDRVPEPSGRQERASGGFERVSGRHERMSGRHEQPSGQQERPSGRHVRPSGLQEQVSGRHHRAEPSGRQERAPMEDYAPGSDQTRLIVAGVIALSIIAAIILFIVSKSDAAEPPAPPLPAPIERSSPG